MLVFGSRLLILENKFLMYTRSQAKHSSRHVFTHIESLQQFQMTVDSDIARIEYVKTGNIYDLVYSYIPKSMRGQGLGHTLAVNTFDYASTNHIKLRLSCGFIRKVFNEHIKQYEHLLA